MNLSPGQRVSEYVLQQRIGAGAFGEVWRAAHHVWHDQLVAIKVPTDPQYVRNLQREGSAVHGLRHPGIVRALGFDPYADPPYLVMEYVPGTSLRPPIQSKALSVADALTILTRVLEALDHAHRNGLVHRDIKPENVLIHERAATEGYAAEGMVKVTDFGLGKVARVSAESIAFSTSLRGPEAERVAGTLEYMAPEQRGGREVDARADLYACGVMLYEMLTGEKPAGTDLPSALNPAVPAHVDEMFRRSYARLEKRFPSARAFLDAMKIDAPPPPQRAGQQGVCPSCSQSVEAGDQFCMHCGAQLVARVRRCARCHAYPDPQDRFCLHCGQALGGSEAASLPRLA